MEKYLSAPIKEIITKFPAVGKILEEYNIGCVPCTLGSCLLKDIVAIHNLSPDIEAELMYRLEKAIYPEREVKRPEIKLLPRKAASREMKYSPPIKRLVEEHTVIKKWLALVPEALENADPGKEKGRRFLEEGLDFIRFFADKFHHAKEEDILFEYTDKNLDIIKTILSDHETARGYVKKAAAAVEKKDKKTLSEALGAYRELLMEHIKKEDEILYPWIDRGLSTTQVGELFSRFNEAEEKIDREVVEKCRSFAEERAEEELKKLRKDKEGLK